MNDATARARELRDTGVSFSVIAATLTAEGYPTSRAGAWHGSSVFRMLQPPKPPGPGRGFRKPHTEESKRKMSESHKRAFANGREPNRGNAKKTHCPQGHPYDEENTYHLPGGGRGCKKCMREHTRKRRRRQGKAERPPSRTPESVRRRRVARNTHEPLVYYAVRDGLVKVGTTTHFRGRMHALGAEEVLAVEPGGRDLEQARHAEFAEYQVIHPDRKGKRGGQNEWFRPGERLIAHATALRGVYSVPDFSKRQRHGPYVLDPEAAAILALLPPPLIPLRPGTLERFVIKITVDGECWRRSASLDAKGYGQFSLEGTQQRSHRASHIMFIGPIPDGFQVDHVKARGCRFKDCVRPAHLEAVPGRVNTLRSGNMAAIHARATHCPAGHEYTPENTYVIQRTGGRTARQCKICTKARRTRRTLTPAQSAYMRRHRRNEAVRGKAKLLKCVYCAARGIDKQACDWAHVHGTDPDDVMNYIPLCRKCHMTYDPRSGHRVPHSAATKALLSQKNTGYQHTPEAREKIRAASTGRKHTPESRTKMSVQQKAAAEARGPMPDEQRAKLSAALKGNTNAAGGRGGIGKRSEQALENLRRGQRRRREREQAEREAISRAGEA